LTIARAVAAPLEVAEVAEATVAEAEAPVEDGAAVDEGALEEEAAAASTVLLPHWIVWHAVIPVRSLGLDWTHCSTHVRHCWAGKLCW
jgi:hypothetical protein